MAARILMVLSASIVFTLGVVHLVYTFWGPKLLPRDPALQISMSQISPVITKETTMWRCWVGFNASHIQCASRRRLHFFGLLSRQHCAIVGLTMRSQRKQAFCAYNLVREDAESLPIPIGV